MNMNFVELANNRYTTKKYDAHLKISEDKIQKLKEILRMSPSSIDSQPWNFAFVASKDIKDQLAKKSLFNEHRVQDASHLVVFNMIDSIPKFEEQINASLPEGSVSYYNQKVKNLPEQEIKVWLSRQVYIALGFFLSACASMGIDSTPMEGIDTEGYANILKLDGYKPLFAVAIGYRDMDDSNQPTITPKLRLDWDDVITDF